MSNEWLKEIKAFMGDEALRHLVVKAMGGSPEQDALYSDEVDIVVENLTKGFMIFNLGQTISDVWYPEIVTKAKHYFDFYYRLNIPGSGEDAYGKRIYHPGRLPSVNGEWLFPKDFPTYECMVWEYQIYHEDDKRKFFAKVLPSVKVMSIHYVLYANRDKPPSESLLMATYVRDDNGDYRRTYLREEPVGQQAFIEWVEAQIAKESV